MNLNKTLLNEEQTNQLISYKLIEKEPFFVSRLGGVECDIISSFFVYGKWNENTKFMALNNAGIYPNDSTGLIKFSVQYSACIKDIDIMGVWERPFYDLMINTFCPQAIYVPLSGIEPYYFPSNPWSKFLKGKKILVIHPFEKSIQNNFRNRIELFKDTEILPDFELITLKADQNIGNDKSNFIISLEKMQKRIKDLNFDIAIIGCGSFGLPLGSFIKNVKEKPAIHLGGAVQILFGIMGKRWETSDRINKFVNNYWTRPFEEEKPPTYNLVEGGCYW